MTDLSLILRNLTRKPLRLTLTLFAIFMAFLIFTVLVTFQLSFGQSVQASADERLITVSKINFTVNLPMAHVNKVKAVPGVKTVGYADWFGGYFKDPANQLVMFAVSVDTYLDMYRELVFDPQQRAAFQQNRQAVAVGAALAKQMGWEIGDRIPMRSNIYQNREGGNTWEMDLVATFTGDTPSVDTNYAIFHHKYFDESRTFGNDSVGWIVLESEDSTQNDAIIEAIDTQFANSPFETSTTTEKAFNRAFIAQLGNIALIITSVVGAAMFVILMIVGNSMVMAIRERTGEIAVLKALGFQSARIFRLVLGESLALSLIGGLMGFGVGAALIGVTTTALPQLSFMVVSGDVIMLALATMLALGLFTGILPARAAMNTNIIRAFQKS